MTYFFLAFLLGIVLLFLVRVTVRRLVYNSTSDDELRSKPLFKACVVCCILGQILAGFGGALLVAYTIKDYF